MLTHWSADKIDYDGSQLRAHWILARFGLVGDACVGFRGACRVATDEIADLEDLDGPGIAADDMVHFVWEVFTSSDLVLAVHRQRLFAARAGEMLQQMSGKPLRRVGDDLYLAEGKLSISIATASPVSTLLHFAVNASPGGAPVPIATLAELAVDPERFGRAMLEGVAAEQESILQARAKVRAKGEWLPGGRA